MNNLPVLYGDHDFTVLNVCELVKHPELESVLVLFFDNLSLKHSVVGKLIGQTNLAVELILSEESVYLSKALPIWCFHGDSKGFLMNLGIIMIIEVASPHFWVVSLQIRIFGLINSLWYTCQECSFVKLGRVSLAAAHHSLRSSSIINIIVVHL